MYSIGTKVFPWICLAMCSFAMGSPFSGRVSIPMYVLDQNEGFHLVLSSFVFLRDGVTLSGLRVHTYVCTVLDRNEGFHLVLSGFVFLRVGAALLGSMSILLYVFDRIEGFNLICSGFQVPSRWVHPVGSCIRFYASTFVS